MMSISNFPTVKLCDLDTTLTYFCWKLKSIDFSSKSIKHTV